MKLVSSYKWASQRVKSIQDAVVGECIDGESREIAESALRTAEQTAEFLGLLTKTLHESGVLSDRNILDLFDNAYEAAEE